MTGTADRALDRARDRLVVRLNRGVNKLAGRDDLIAHVHWDASPRQPPAWFDPVAGDVTLNGPIALAGAHPADMNPLTAAGRRRHPVLVGLLCHEASHAHSTRWHAGVDGQTAVVCKAAALLEEPRIEHRQIQRRPMDRPYLAAASRLLILPGAATPSGAATRWRAAQAALLTAGRVDAGVLDAAEIDAVLDLCLDALGYDDLVALRAVWRDVLALADGDSAGLLAAATRWVQIIGAEDATDIPEPACSAGIPTIAAPDGDDEPGTDPTDPDDSRPDDTPGEEGTDTACTGDTESDADDSRDDTRDDGERDGDELGRTFRAAVREVSDTIVVELTGEPADPDDTPTPPAAIASAPTDLADTERGAAEDMAHTVFHSTVHGGRTAYHNPLGPSRLPTTDERILARQLATALRRAQFREPATMVTPSPVPPGRLIGRDAMLGTAQRALGQPVTAQPFRRVTRRPTPRPPLRVGIAVDVSGSMDWATGIMATTAWMVAHAVGDVGGRSAAVAFGAQVTPITSPGLVPVQVPSFDAQDNAEMFTDALHALDGGLRLTAGDGTRLIFVVSDGDFVVTGEDARARRAIAHQLACGVRVLWLDFAKHPSQILPGALRVPVTSLTDIPSQVGDILVTALRNA